MAENIQNIKNQQVNRLADDKPEGISGWLGLFIFGMFLSIIINVISLIGLPSAFSEVNSSAEIIPDIVSDMNLILWLVVVTSVLVITASVVVIVFIFRKKASAINWVKYFLVANMFFAIITYFLLNNFVNSYPNIVPKDITHDGIKYIFQSFTSGIIWISYFSKSKRVKNTLVK